MPAVKINVERWLEKGKFLFNAANIAAAHIQLKFRQKGENPFLYRAELCAVGAENFKAVPPRKLTLYYLKRVARFVINIVAVKPGKKALFKKHFHNITLRYL